MALISDSGMFKVKRFCHVYLVRVTKLYLLGCSCYYVLLLIMVMRMGI